MINTTWPILIVDDEPDVLKMSEVVMNDFTVFGLPVELHTAASKAEAIELMTTKLVPPMPMLPAPRAVVAFIDVVMETDTAGLELCDYIRNTLGNHTIQLFIRTGQPGVAPEREVIDTYDINGYFTKAEATEDKLYSLVKSGVRQALSFLAATLTSIESSMLNEHAGSRESLRRFLHTAPVFQRDGHFLFIDGEAITGTLPSVDAKTLMAQLDQMDGQPLSPNGDKFVADDDRNMMIKVAGTETSAEVVQVIQGDWQFIPPDIVKSFGHSTLSNLASHWNQVA